MQTDIRKISVGKDYPNKAIHFLVSKPIELQGVAYIVSAIKKSPEYAAEGKTAYDIYLANSEGSVMWKTIHDVPVVVEYNISFE